jgi:hypothetical protein
LLLLLSQTVTGYRVEVVTVRKLEFETDAFAFADKVRSMRQAADQRSCSKDVMWSGNRRAAVKERFAGDGVSHLLYCGLAQDMPAVLPSPCSKA